MIERLTNDDTKAMFDKINELVDWANGVFTPPGRTQPESDASILARGTHQRRWAALSARDRVEAMRLNQFPADVLASLEPSPYPTQYPAATPYPAQTPASVKGDRGPQGPKGDKGDKGDPAVSTTKFR
jgi:hypothetical protein